MPEKDDRKPILTSCVTHYYKEENPKKGDEPFFQVFNQARLEIFQGDLLMIKGKSGQGKSTLIKILGGLLRPSQGYVFWGTDCVYRDVEGLEKIQCPMGSCDDCGNYNAELSKEPVDDIDALRGNRISFVLQDPNLVEHFTAIKNVALPLIMGKSSIEYQKANEEAERLLDLVELEKEHWKKKAHKLSGGQKQRVSIARALASRPQILLADEPFTGLDKKNQKLIWEGICRYRKEEDPKVAILIITHDEELLNEEGVFSPPRDEQPRATRYIKFSDGDKKLSISRELSKYRTEKKQRKRPDGMMKCPRCPDNAACQTETVGEVTLDVCPKCGGIWLDRGELNELWLHMNKFMDEAIHKNLLDLFN